MQTSDLRIAFFSGNYNMTVDGANKAQNRLVEYLLRQGAQVRVYSPTMEKPAFPANVELVSIPSVAIPGRSEYRLPLSLSRTVRGDLEQFAPNVIHISSPDRACRQASKWAIKRGLPVLGCVHTRFETYFRYYNMSFMEPLVVAWLRRLYRRCDALVAPSESMAQMLRQQRMNYDIAIWSRGVDRELLNPARRDMRWRRDMGIADDTPVIAFLGRLVMEKGLDVFSDGIDQLNRRGIRHRVMVIGDGPARSWFETRLPDAAFIGFQSGEGLARALASSDMLFNPSVTEAFGNVTLEAMACGLPIVAADATGAQNLVDNGKSGRLVAPGAIAQFAEALRSYCEHPSLRAEHGKAGVERAQEFSWDTINQVVADTYLRLIRQRAARAMSAA